ncbi:MAG: DUF4250 domain-containing protein [Lachnospiraceae bacterium]|nr:DUF4250 domain-containing protein [Lachnospiraceae bacterium]
MSMYDNLPKDPVILLSFTNTQLRDTFESLSAFCTNFQISEEDICTKLAVLNYKYDEKTNQFI